MQLAPRLAAAQTVPVASDIDANIAEHVQLAELAAAEHVTLLAFPELSLTGYELAAGPRRALEADDRRLAPLLSAARRHGMTLVVGAPARLASGLHIAAFIIEPTGSVQVYTKQHLGAFRPEDHPGGAVPPPEQDFYTPGHSNPTFPWASHRVAVSICKDSALPSHPEAAAERGATVYVSSQFAIEAHMRFKLSRLKDAARRHALIVVFSNYGGATGGLIAAGGSCVRATDGETVVRLPERGRGLAIAWEDGGRWTGKTVVCPVLA